MNNKNNFIATLSRTLAIVLILFAFSCKEEALEEHYEQLDDRLETSILETLSSDSDYSTFLQLIKQTGYEHLLSSSQAFTVWAPNNEALSMVSSTILNDDVALTALIGNHISRFTYNSTISYNEELQDNSVLVKMFNNKYVEFSNAGGQVTFGDVAVQDADILTTNGVLHKMSDVLTVSPNIWSYLNDNANDFPELITYFEQFNKISFDEENSVSLGQNSLGQTVYDSVFSITNTRFSTIGDLSSEESRFTFLGLTDAAYTGVYDSFKDFYQFPVEDSVKTNTNRTIFNNLNFFPIVELEDLDGITTNRNTAGNNVIIDPASVTENFSLSNGNLFVVNELNYDPKNVMYKPIRYEIENPERRTIGNLSEFSVVQDFDETASGRFTNTVNLLANPDNNDSNNYVEVAFTNVLSASYKINVKFSRVGASKKTKLKFELSYVDASKQTVVHEIDAIDVSNLEEGVVTIGDIYDIPVFVNNEIDNDYFVKLKVIVDVIDAELILYDRKFGLDYVELTPVE
ncbi:fasciclin domain-containing protein [Algibacter sp. AS12]|uniref:fasciclin domain-containing protein n=1 Tax=Algibacter sp. AS12 TaxID=3135773 RepID=UPI00398B6A0A